MIEKLTKSTMTDSVTKTDSTTQVDLALSAQPSSTSVEPYNSPSEVSPVASSSSLPSTAVGHYSKGHKRARSDGEVAVQESRMRDALVKVKDLSESVQTGMPLSEALQRHRERVTPRYQERGNQCEESRRREERQRQCSGLNCLWRQQLKSSQQRLKTLSKQVAITFSICVTVVLCSLLSLVSRSTLCLIYCNKRKTSDWMQRKRLKQPNRNYTNLN